MVLDSLLSIGAMSRASGLSVSALRFYDRSGVLAPAEVDAHTGYRRYRADQVRPAQVVAALRGVGMPVAHLAAVLEAGSDTETVDDLIAQHRERLLAAHEAALRALERVARLVGEQPPAQEIEVDAHALRRALDSVRYAAAGDDRIPVLRAVLLDQDADGVRAVATDRYRLAVCEVEDAVAGPDVRVVLPLPLVQALLEGPVTGPLRLVADGEQVEVQVAGRVDAWPSVVGDYPDHRVLLPVLDQSGSGAVLAAEEVRARLADPSAPAHPTWELAGEVVVDRGFLWDAVRHADGGTVALPRPDRLTPVVVRSHDDRQLALVMPIRPTGHTAGGEVRA